MLSAHSEYLGKLSIILASQSPRRQAILRENLNLNFDVLVSGFAEDIDKTLCSTPSDYVAKTSLKKAEDVISVLQISDRQVDIVISADTIVVLDTHILEKPVDKGHAIEMLRRLSGRGHLVLTAVTIAVRNGIRFNSVESSERASTGVSYHYETFVESTEVTFANLDEKTILAYVDSGEPMDKAGSYGIQSLGASLVSGVRGCYFNVVGFPIHRFSSELVKILSSEI